MFPGHDSHVYNKLVSRAQYARVRTVLTAYMQRRITESTCFLCAQQSNTLLVRDEPFTAPPTVRGTCSERSGLRTHDADSLALPPDAAIFLACLRSIDKRLKLRKTYEGGWDPPVSEAGWRKNRSAQTLSFEAAETLGSPLYSRRQQPATQVDLPIPAYRIASLPVYSQCYCVRLSSSSSARVDIVRHGNYRDCCNLIGTSTFRHGLTKTWL